MTTDDDVIVIGAGAAGGIVASLLAEAGKTVLLLDRGSHVSAPQVARDHVRNHRLSLYGHNTGPALEGNPRVTVSSDGHTRIVRPHEGGYQNNAMAVGGGTLVYGAQAWRFLPKDFRMASVCGAPEGSSLADWPITYDELAPYYDRAEREVGVSGDAAQMACHPSRAPFPLPPHEPTRAGAILRQGADALARRTHPVPLLINMSAYNGRAACIRCGMCVGFGCPVNAKNGSQNTLLPRGLATDNLILHSEAHAERIETDVRGNATGVWYFHNHQRTFASAKTIVVSAGAIESARLLFNSASDRHPHGIGNHSDHLGRHLQGHYYNGAHGEFAEVVHDGIGPGPVISTCDFNHGNPGIIGGAMLANEFIKLPILFNRWSWPPDLPRWGIAAKRFMRDGYRRVLQVQGPIQEIPAPEARVTLDPTVRDSFGIPVARLSGLAHPETIRTTEFMRGKCEQWLTASGARRVWSRPTVRFLSGGQHQAGTCRMSDDPHHGVTDRYGKIQGTDNIYVSDGSLHVTNGGFNPVLTIMAMAFRNAEWISRQI